MSKATPSVSGIIVKYVVERYPSIIDLCMAYDKLDTREEKLVAVKRMQDYY